MNMKEVIEEAGDSRILQGASGTRKKTRVIEGH